MTLRKPTARRRSIRSLATLLGLALVAGGCGGSEEPVAEPDADAAVVVDDKAENGDEPESPEPSSEEPETEGSGTATMTIADDTVYEFVLSSCDTQDTDPSGFPLSNGYDIGGKTEDGAFSVSLGRAGFTDEDVFFSGSLEGDFDEEGKNAKMLYSVNGETVDLTASGNQVNGSMDLRAVGPPTRPHGDETTATFEATC